MIEPLYGPSVPVWAAAPGAGFGVQGSTVANGALTAPLFGARTIPGLPTTPPVAAASPTMPGVAPAMPSYAPSFYTTDPSAVLVSVRGEAMAGMVAAPALLAVVAMRRGQPQGPTTDQEVEEFIYDALELLPGTGDVEVRYEAGKVTLTGTVQHKRVKRDAGEIVWAIPSLLDVQNNITITSRRRSRSSTKEAEAPVSVAPRKQS